MCKGHSAQCYFDSGQQSWRLVYSLATEEEALTSSDGGIFEA